MLINRYFTLFRTAARGMEAQRVAMGTASENIANAGTSLTENGTPYELKRAVHESPNPQAQLFSQMLNEMQGALDTRDSRHIGQNSLRRRIFDTEMGPETTVATEQKFRMEFDPTHPHADGNGYVSYPDINLVEEMARMVSANRIYEANLTAVQAAKEMIKRTLEI